MNALLAIRVDAEPTHGLQPLDDPGEVFLRWLLRPFAQPDEQRASQFVVHGEHGLELGDRLRRETFSKTLVRALASESTRRQSDLFQGDGRREQNAPSPQMFDHRGNDRVATIGSRRLLDRDMRNGAVILAAKRSNVEVGLQFAKVRSAGLLPVRIFLKRLGVVSNLRRDESEHVGGRPLVHANDSARETQIGEMHGKAEPIGRAAALANQRQVFCRVGVVPHDSRQLRRWIEQRRA